MPSADTGNGSPAIPHRRSGLPWPTPTARRGERERRLPSANDGLARFPQDTTVRLVLVKALIDEEQLDDAGAELDAIIALEPSRRRGAAARRRGCTCGPAAAWRRAGTSTPQWTSTPTTGTPSICWRWWPPTGGCPRVAPSARALADDLFATRTVAAVCLDQGLPEEAAQICIRILRTSPDDPRARAMLAQALRPRTSKRRAG